MEKTDNIIKAEPRNITRNINEYALPYPLWIIYETFSILLISLSLYIFATQLRFTCQKRKPQQFPGSDMALANISGLSLRQSLKRTNQLRTNQKRSGTGQSAQSLKILCLLGSFFAVLRISSDQLELATYGSARIDCKIYQVTVVVTYALSSTFIYSSLWLRLRIFFFHPIMKHLSSTPIVILIWFALGCILFSSFLNTAIFIATVESIDSTFGCILGNTTSITPISRYVILTASTVMSQGILLCLFLYPLVKHRSKLKTLAAKKMFYAACHPVDLINPAIANSLDSSQFQKEKNSIQMSRKLRREKRFISVIRRVLCTAIVCVISDVITAVTTILLGDQPRVVTNMVFNFNLIVNMLSVLCSFGDWRKRLLPCCAKAKKLDSKFQNQTPTNCIEKNNEFKTNKDLVSADVLFDTPIRTSFTNKPEPVLPVHA